MDREQQRLIVQNNLLHIRKTLKLSAKEFGALIGVTRQTINNIESGRHTLTMVQFLAIRYVLDNDIIPYLTRDERASIIKLLCTKVLDRNYVDSLIFE